MDDNANDQTVTLSSGTQQLNEYQIPAAGFLNGVYILVENTVTSSTATATSTSTGVGVQVEDGPYTVINQINFVDTNNANIVGPITGFDLYVINKWGGYAFNDDPEANTDLFTSTTNATASSSAAGSFSFALRIPVEIVPRDALGTLPNKSQSTPFRVKVTVGSIAQVYANTATVGGSCRFRMTPKAYWEPTATDSNGNAVANQPPGVNTTQFWQVTPYTIASGNFVLQLVNAVGYPIRNLGFILRDSSATRSGGETNFPDPFQVQLQSNMIVNRIKKIWKKEITQDFNYTAAGDAAGQKDNGLYWLSFNKDFGPKPGWETRRSYLRTTDGMRLQLQGNIGGSGTQTLTVYNNYVSPGPGTTLAAITS